MKLSDLKRHIEIQAPVKTPDTGGGYAPGWQTVYSLTAQVINTTGNVVMRYGKLEAIDQWIITIRYSPTYIIGTNMQVLYGSHVLKIMSVTNVQGANKWLKISCQEAR